MLLFSLTHTAAQEAAGGRALQLEVPAVHDVPLEELTQKLRAAWASFCESQDPASVKQARTFTAWQYTACFPHSMSPCLHAGSGWQSPLLSGKITW